MLKNRPMHTTMAELNKQKALARAAINNEMGVRGERQFVDSQRYAYLYQSHIPAVGQPQMIDLIDANNRIYGTCAAQMLRRMRMYPYLSYVFLTNNSRSEVSDFFARYPGFENIVNVIEYTREMKLIISFLQIPSCFIVNQNNIIIYDGSINVEKFGRKACFLNELCRNHYHMRPRDQFKKQPLSIKNNQLSLVLSGLCKNQQQPDLDAPGHMGIVLQARPKSAASIKQQFDDAKSDITSLHYEDLQHSESAVSQQPIKAAMAKQRPMSAQPSKSLNLADQIQPFQNLITQQNYSTFQIGRNAAVKHQCDSIRSTGRQFTTGFIDRVIDCFE